MSLDIVVGRVHPDLEQALVGRLRALKAEDPWAPVLILVPSEPLARRLRVLLAVEQGLALVGVSLWTFHRLSRHLAAEAGLPEGLDLAPDGLLEEGVRRLLHHYGQEAVFQPLAPLARQEGACGALWQTLRDLRDAGVHPEVALEALEKGHFPEEDPVRLRALLALHGLLEGWLGPQTLPDYTTLDRLAREQIPRSPFLQGLRHIFYVGFYDLTQVQVDLFHEVARHYPVTLLFPWVPETESWAFARRFLERYVEGWCAAPLQVPRGLDPIQGLPRLRVVSCRDPLEEVRTTAREILQWVEEGGVDFTEIGVVARSLSPYLPLIRRVFEEYQIPWMGFEGEPLHQHPLAQGVLALVEVLEQGLPRGRLLDLVASPHFRLPGDLGAAPPPLDRWDFLTRTLGLTRGEETWGRLRQLLQEGPEAFPEALFPGGLDSRDQDALQGLWTLVETLQGAFRDTPEEAPWSRHARVWADLVARFLDLGADPPVQAQVETLFQRLAWLDAVEPAVDRATFLETLRRHLIRGQIPPERAHPPGVWVLDAMGARGLSFRVLFVLGLNDRVFPRVIREDAFLRDPSRQVLEQDLGFKIPRKLEAYDEERLLFGLLVHAAREEGVFLWARQSLSGEPQVRSPYLARIRSVLCPERPEAVSLREEEAPGPFFSRLRYTSLQEAAQWACLQGVDPTPLLVERTPNGGFLQGSLRWLRHLEDEDASPGPQDGWIGPGAFRHLFPEDRPLSPTALEQYTQCPFRFFLETLLGLRPLEEPDPLGEPSPLWIGQMCHEILQVFYETWKEACRIRPGPEGLVQHRSLGEGVAPGVWEDLEGRLRMAAIPVLERYGRLWGGTYPVWWEAFRERLLGFLLGVLQEDLRETLKGGWYPEAFEHPVEGTWAGVVFRGRIDRLDRGTTPGGTPQFRVVDYKFTLKKKWEPQDENLLQEAFQGRRIQPPVYEALVAQAGGVTPRDVVVELFHLTPRNPQGVFHPVALEWKADGGGGEEADWGRDHFQARLQWWLEGLREGAFYMMVEQDGQCSFCPVEAACRWLQEPARRRTRRDDRVRRHWEYRTQKIPKSKKSGGRKT